MPILIIFLWVIFSVLGLFIIVSFKTFILLLRGALWVLIIGIPEKLMPWIVLGAEEKRRVKRELKAAGVYPSLKVRFISFIQRLGRAFIETFTDPVVEMKQAIFRGERQAEN